MGKFKKQIVSAGKYHVSTPGNERAEVTITPERIRGWANTISELQKAGHKIPAPFNHDLKSVPVIEGNSGALVTSEQNGGFWNDISIEVNENNVPVLMGQLETPHDDKVGATIKDVSIYVKPEWIDGTGRIWRDVPMHIALVTHPIEPGQPNFEPVDDDIAIAMSHISMAMSDDYTMYPVGSSLTSIVKDLRDVASIDIGDDVTPENVVERLSIALRQKRISEQAAGGSAGSVSKPPEGATRESVPIQMSQEQVQETTEQVVETDEVKALKQQNEALMMSVATNKKVSLEARISALQTSNKITEAYALELKKALEGFKMSLNADGSESISKTETIIEAFELGANVAEATARHPGEPLVMSSLPPGHQIEVQDNGEDMSGERIADLTKSFMTRTR